MRARLAWNPGYHSFPKWAIFEKFSFQNFWKHRSGVIWNILAESKRAIGHINDTAGNSEGFVEKVENLNGRGVNDYGIPRAWGITHFGISEVKRGLKKGRCPWYVMDIFCGRSSCSNIAWEQALWGALATGRGKEGKLATRSLKFEYLHRKSRCEMLFTG